ncbi:hypothetical protein A9Q84_02435 [Halobacteriovorax marinus]|uniref:Methyltransferase domain-containing protein n=1 Tax=Halobacteriovorax marinus TaxID=97084 RepID=A0A1Y5FJ81_9BACT|nr:hypothetical protein A9Q84_02435 [Halobacteriovorax marinus]
MGNVLNFKQHFDQLTEFLKPYEGMWNEELLDDYPRHMAPYQDSWIDELSALSKEQLWRFDCFLETEHIQNPEILELSKKRKDLIELEQFKIYEKKSYTEWAFKKVKEKKRHEISLITSLITELNDDHSFSHTTDIGGGVGHLARILAHYCGIKTKTIDIEADFQKSGIKRANAYPLPKGANDLEFINMNFIGDKDQEIMKNVFSKDSLTLGLHTCGPLANALIETHITMGTKILLNFGCCYLKMNPETDVNLSQYAKQGNHLKLKKWALTMASRGYTSMNFNEYLLKERVKSFRYSLQLLLNKIVGKSHFVSVGDGHSREYWGDFSDYAMKRLKVLNLDSGYNEELLTEFYEDADIKKEVKRMYLGNILRWQFGRCLEHYILTDRCLLLEEAGQSVELKELFDEELSPRNIGILATQKI